MAVKRWIWWVLGTLAFFGFLAMAGIGACVYFVASHFDAREVTATQAEAEFEAVRARFKDQQPLLEIKRNGQVLVDRLEERAATYKGRAPGVAAHPRVGAGRSEAGADHAADVAAADEGHDGPQVLAKSGWRSSTSKSRISSGPAQSLLVDHTDGRHRLLVWTE